MQVVLKVLGTLVWTGLCLTLIPFLWTQQPVRRDACAKDLPAWIEVVCPLEDRSVSEGEATEWVDDMLAKVRGSQRALGVAEQMTTLGSDTRATSEFVQDWDWMMFGMRVSDVAPTGRVLNEFRVTVNRFIVPIARRDPQAFYQAPETDFYQDTYVVRLERTEDGLKATRISRDGRSGLGRAVQRHVKAIVATDNYRSLATKYDGKYNIPKGSWIYEVCQFKARSGPNTGKWLARTYLGWTPHADLDGGDGRVDAVQLCDFKP